MRFVRFGSLLAAVALVAIAARAGAQQGGGVAVGQKVPDKTFTAPGRPVAFETDNGPSGGGWDAVDLRQYVLLPVTNSDFVDRVWLDEAQTYTFWN